MYCRRSPICYSTLHRTLCPCRQYSDSEGIFDSKCTGDLNSIKLKTNYKSSLPHKIGNEIEYVQIKNEEYSKIQVCCSDVGDKDCAQTDVKRVAYPIQSQFRHGCNNKHKPRVSVVAFFVKITYSHTPKQNGANKNAKGNKTEVFWCSDYQDCYGENTIDDYYQKN